MYPEINKDLCINCGTCRNECPADVFDTSADGMIKVVAPEDCIYCGNCVEACCEHAITYEGD